MHNVEGCPQLVDSVYLTPINISSAFLRSFWGISKAGSTPGLMTLIFFSLTPSSIAKFLVKLEHARFWI